MFFPSAKCPHCKGSNFELQRVEPAGSRVAMQFILCTSCKAPVGVAEYYDSGTLLKKQEKEIEALKRKIDQIDYNVQAIISGLNQMMRRAA